MDALTILLIIALIPVALFAGGIFALFLLVLFGFIVVAMVAGIMSYRKGNYHNRVPLVSARHGP